MTEDARRNRYADFLLRGVLGMVAGARATARHQRSRTPEDDRIHRNAIQDRTDKRYTDCTNKRWQDRTDQRKNDRTD